VKIIVSVFCIVFLFSSVSVASNYDSFQKYLGKNEVELTQEIQDFNTAQLFAEFNKIASVTNIQSDVSVLIPLMKELVNRKDEIQNSEIIDFISNKSNSVVARENMIDFFMIKNTEDPAKKNEIKSLLTDDEIETELKARIVIIVPLKTEDINLLVDFVEKDAGILAFNSLKRISKINEKLAYEISSNILSEQDSHSELKISAALKATSKYFKNNVNKSSDTVYSINEYEFIELNKKIINSNESALLKDAALFSLSELGTKESLLEIINNKNIDIELKAYAIDENAKVLEDILKNSSDISDIEMVIQALEILPVNNLIEDLETATKNINDSELIEKSEKVLKTKSKSINSTNKY